LLRKLGSGFKLDKSPSVTYHEEITSKSPVKNLSVSNMESLFSTRENDREQKYRGDILFSKNEPKDTSKLAQNLNTQIGSNFCYSSTMSETFFPSKNGVKNVPQNSRPEKELSYNKNKNKKITFRSHSTDCNEITALPRRQK